MEAQPEDRRKPQDVKNHQRHDAWPRGDVWMEQIRENLTATRAEEVSKRIASLSKIRRGEVLAIRRQLMQGTYEVADQLCWRWMG
jgi:hypothetical protein